MFFGGDVLELKNLTLDEPITARAQLGTKVAAILRDAGQRFVAARLQRHDHGFGRLEVGGRPFDRVGHNDGTVDP